MCCTEHHPLLFHPHWYINVQLFCTLNNCHIRNVREEKNRKKEGEFCWNWERIFKKIMQSMKTPCEFLSLYFFKFMLNNLSLNLPLWIMGSLTPDHFWFSQFGSIQLVLLFARAARLQNIFQLANYFSLKWPVNQWDCFWTHLSVSMDMSRTLQIVWCLSLRIKVML